MDEVVHSIILSTEVKNGWIFTLVYSVRIVLAIGDHGFDCLSFYLADFIAISFNWVHR